MMLTTNKLTHALTVLLDEADIMERKLALAFELLSKNQWIFDGYTEISYCPHCENADYQGHKVGCYYKMILDELGDYLNLTSKDELLKIKKEIEQ